MENMTLKDLDHFSHKLHVNTVCNLLINTVATVFVIFYSTAQMKFYKHYILFTVLAGAVMDFQLSFVYGFFIALPITGTCCAGVSRHFGSVGGSFVQYIIAVYMLGAVGISLFLSITYRYYSLTNRSELFHSKKMVFLALAAVLVFPLPSVVGAIYAQAGYSDEAMVEYVTRNAPQYLDLFTHANCNAFTSSSKTTVAMAVSAVQLSFGYGMGFGYIVLIVKELKRVRSSLSPATYAMQKEFFKALCAQLTIPMLFLFVPGVVGFATFGLGTGSSINLAKAGQYAVQLFAFHGSANGLSVLYFYPCYRKAISLMLKNVCRIKTAVGSECQTPVVTIKVEDSKSEAIMVKFRPTN